MKVRKLVLTATPVLIVLGALTAVLAWSRTAPVFSGTVAITFTERGLDRPDKKISVTDAREVQRILGTIHLKRKDSCQCSHLHEVTFLKPAGQIEVSICEHCFAVLGAKKNGWYPHVRDYWMPTQFYSEFRKLALSRTNEHWHVQP